MDFMEKFNDSYQAVLGDDERAEVFWDLFYRNFLKRSDAIKSRFSNTDLKKQARMVRVSLNYIVNFFVTKRSSDYLEKIALLHGKTNLNILPEMYDEWIGALMETLLELYPFFDRTVELSWRIVLAPGIEYMRFHYDP